MKAKGGNKYAIVATANKLATIYYKMVRFKKEFIPVDIIDYRAKNKQAKINYLERKLAQLKAEAASSRVKGGSPYRKRIEKIVLHG